MTGTRSQPTRTRAEHAAIAKASSEWEHEVVRGLTAFVGQSIPLDRHERMRVTHIINIAEDETFAGWYNWRGVTNPDIVLLGLLEGGPDDGARAAIAVDAKLSARSRKTQILTETLAQLLEPFQPLSNHVDGLLGEGKSGTLVLRNGFHVVRGVETTVGNTAKTTRALLDPEFAAEFMATKPVALHAPERAPAERTPRARRAPRPQPAVPTPALAATQEAALLRETVWSLDRLCSAGMEMPESKGIFTMTDILALDHMEGTPADCIILGMHGDEPVAQGVALGPKRALPTEEEMKALLAILPAPMCDVTYRIAPPFRVVPGKTNTLPVLGNRRTVVLPVALPRRHASEAAAAGGS
jgi:hypothetical protein